MKRFSTIAAALVVSCGGAWAALPAAPPVKPEAYYHYSLAQQMILERDYLHALEQMEHAVQSDSSPSLLLELAQLRFSLNDLTGAAEIAEKVAGSEGASNDAHRLLGDIHLTRARDGADADAEIGLAIDQYRAALKADPADIEAVRSLADLLYHTGRLKDAGDVLLEFGRRRPLDTSLSLLLGKVYARTGRLGDAETTLRQVVARVPGSLEAVDALASLLEYEKKYDEAIAAYTSVIDDDSGSPYVHQRLGTLQLLAGRPQEAIRELLKAQAIDPDDSRGALPLAEAYEATDNVESALEIYDGIIRKEPGNLEARFQRAHLLQKEQQDARALKGYQEIIDLANGRGAVSDREAAILALTHSQTGILKMEARQYEAAVDSFTQALNATDEPGPELFLLLGRANLEAGRREDARRVATEAVKRFPEDVDVKVFQGEVLVASGGDESARDLFQGIVNQASGSAAAYGAVSEALLRQKRYDLAESFLKEGTRRHADDDALQFARGAALERLGRNAEAEKCLARAIRLNGKNAMALNYLGFMLADRGVRLQDALGYVQRALAIDPRNAAYLDSLGWAQFRLAHYGEAEKSLREALGYDADDPTIREHLGDVLSRTGRIDEAVREWQSSLERGPEDPDRVKRKIQKARSGRPVTP